MSKPILCVDFDGVIHSYTSGWKGIDIIPDPITTGFFEWLETADPVFSVCIYSSRSKEARGIKAMQEYVSNAAIDHYGDNVPQHVDNLWYAHEKPAAFMTIDDRAVQFTGDWNKLHPLDLINFKPWNKK